MERIRHHYYRIRDISASVGSDLASSAPEQSLPQIQSSSSNNATATDEYRNAIAQVSQSPWTFLTSAYMMSLIFMAFAVNRIQNIVPPRLGRGYAFHPEAFATSRSVERARTKLKTFLLRLPSLLLLFRASVNVAAVMLNHLYGLNFARLAPLARFLVWSTKWAGSFDALTDVAKLADDQTYQPDWQAVMWLSFEATSLAVVTEAFVRSLQDDLASQSSFNLLSFSFLLHVHSGTPQGFFPTSVVTHLLITLLELFSLHLSFALPLPPLRWPITAFYNVLGQMYTLKVMFDYLNDPSIENGAHWDGPVWINRVPELGIEAVILFSWLLRLSAALLRAEPISTSSILGHDVNRPRMREDFGVSLFRYGVSCLESTTLSGLAHEVSPINVIWPSTSNALTRSQDRKKRDRVELLRSTTNPAVLHLASEHDNGFENEIVDVDVSRDDIDPPTTESQRLWSMIRIAFYWGYVTYSKGRAVYKVARRKAGRKIDEDALEEHWVAREPDDSDSSYTTDEDDDDDSSSDSSGASSDVDDEDLPEEETSALIRDVTLNGQAEASALAAHLAHSTPLTRSAFNIDALVLRKRGRIDPDSEISASACVVCTVEPRSIICWPCRCLNLCEDCRGSLARRQTSSNGSRLCPTCRTPVKGFSRIYVP